MVNNMSKAINATAVEFREKWQTDNDIIRTVSIQYDPYTCDSTEITDCNGFLERHINPYHKGLIGNYRPYRSLVFYGSRTGAPLGAATNLPNNGLLDNFKLYWDFDGSNNLVPDGGNTQWVWNSQVTRINAKGMELETKDAMNIFTGAQYGYDKTLPVAIANNSRYNELAFEGFEDYGYSESLNGAIGNPCTKRHIDFTGIANTQIVNTSQAAFNAHSGSNVLGINANSTAVKSIPVSNSMIDTANLRFGGNVVKALSFSGGNYFKEFSLPTSAPAFAPTFTASNLGMNLNFGSHNVTGQVSGSILEYYVVYKTRQYTEITTPIPIILL